MDAQQLFDVLAKLGGGVFVVSSMLAMGLSLTVGQIIASLKAPLRVILALAVNFALVPRGGQALG